MELERVIAFPIRNPHANIKDAQKLTAAELVPEPGFGQVRPEGPSTIKNSSTSEFGSSIRRKRNSADSSGVGAEKERSSSNVEAADQTDILNLSRVDTCLIRMEELEMEVKGIL
jgi:hypothetical protein